MRAIFFTCFSFTLCSVAIGIYGCRQEFPENWMFAGFCLLFGLWMGFVAMAPRVAAFLPRGWHREHQTWA